MEKGILTKKDLIKQLENGKGLGARIGKRELNYVRKLWKGEKMKNGFSYMKKKYVWKKDARFQGIIDCTCKRCQKFVKNLVKEGQLKEIKRTKKKNLRR